PPLHGRCASGRIAADTRHPACAADGRRRRLNGGASDTVAHVLVGYGLLQALLLLRLLPWIMEQPFAVSYWAFTFGATALAIAPVRMVGQGDTGAIAMLAPWLLVGANVVVGL